MRSGNSSSRLGPRRGPSLTFINSATQQDDPDVACHGRSFQRSAFAQGSPAFGHFLPNYVGCILGKFSEKCTALKRARKKTMRISEDRYSRERLCLQLALRFLEHEARTQTIRTWTGLSDDRIRKLYRSYMTRASRYVPRHRGQVTTPGRPTSPAPFECNRRRFGRALLSLLGVIPPEPWHRRGSCAAQRGARGVAVSGVRNLSGDDSLFADLVRARSVSHNDLVAWRAITARRLYRLRQPGSRRAIPHPRQALPPLREFHSVRACERIFVPGFQEILAPLVETVGGGTSFLWSH